MKINNPNSIIYLRNDSDSHNFKGECYPILKSRSKNNIKKNLLIN